MNTQTDILTNGHTKTPPNFDIVPLWLSHRPHNACTLMQTFSSQVYVESFKNRLTMEERLARIESFDYLPILGPVRMSDPDVVYSNFEFWGMDANRLPKAPYRYVNKSGDASDFINRLLYRVILV